MVGIVLASHSTRLAEGAAELVAQVARGVRVVPAGGTDGRLGIRPQRIYAAIAAADTGDGVLLIPALGRSVLTALSLLADLEPRHGGKQVVLADAPFVEGAVAASGGFDLATVAMAAQEARAVRKL